MAFWKELGVAALEKGKSFFRGGKQALHATKETENYMPLALDLSHKILQEIAGYGSGHGS